MRVLSFDVGIKNLAYCIIEWTNSDNLKSNLKIHHWDIINVINDKKKEDEINYKCISVECKLKPKSYIEFNNFKYCMCTKHLKDKDNLTKNIFDAYSEDKWTTIIPLPTSDIKCSMCVETTNENIDILTETTTKTKTKTKPSKKTFYSNLQINNNILCNKHYKQVLLKSATAQKKIISFKKSKVKDITNNELKLQLIKSLDSRKNILLENIDMVLIENQPTFKNPTMKSVSDTIYTWFMIRGIVDTTFNNSVIKEIKFISPSNKLKEFNTETIDEADANHKYKITKKLSIENTKTILASYSLNDNISRLLSFDKKDDLADSFLQGWYVLNSINNEQLYKEWQTLYNLIKVKTN